MPCDPNMIQVISVPYLPSPSMKLATKMQVDEDDDGDDDDNDDDDDDGGDEDDDEDVDDYGDD